MDEVAEIILSSLFIDSSLIPGITILSISSFGVLVTRTRFAPECKCSSNSSLLRYLPVASTTKSTSKVSQGMVPGLPPERILTF